MYYIRFENKLQSSPVYSHNSAHMSLNHKFFEIYKISLHTNMKQKLLNTKFFQIYQISIHKNMKKKTNKQKNNRHAQTSKAKCSKKQSFQ